MKEEAEKQRAAREELERLEREKARQLNERAQQERRILVEREAAREREVEEARQKQRLQAELEQSQALQERKEREQRRQERLRADAEQEVESVVASGVALGEDARQRAIKQQQTKEEAAIEKEAEQLRARIAELQRIKDAADAEEVRKRAVQREEEQVVSLPKNFCKVATSAFVGIAWFCVAVVSERASCLSQPLYILSQAAALSKIRVDEEQLARRRREQSEQRRSLDDESAGASPAVDRLRKADRAGSPYSSSSGAGTPQSKVRRSVFSTWVKNMTCVGEEHDLTSCCPYFQRG